MKPTLKIIIPLLIGTLASLGVALAQPPIGILDDRVDTLLRQWSERTSKIESLYVEFTRTTFDPVWRAKEVAKGSARYLAPKMARLDIGGDNPESYVLTGDGEIWEYKAAIEQLTIFELPEEMRKDADLQDGPLPFLLGADPGKAKARYRIDIIAEDEKLVHLKITPKLQEDMQNFTTVELWLNRETFLPEKLFFTEPNQSEVTFDFADPDPKETGTRIWINIDISPDDFRGRMPTGDKWRIIRRKVEATAAKTDPRGAEMPFSR
ncbi:Outer-membrane lipoprotein carrier protein [Planctomycetes bacterium Pan216]|uniref:Outer-membrane lipoprotein carrier protein n=1 Tax=Kolteria novifilia TaxID=2527975 RepID=A0A518BAL7_9BACT|nr:Outer-membrane lipoprotein carrier protein [Planctomycetes bacterium Pan216]